MSCTTQVDRDRIHRDSPPQRGIPEAAAALIESTRGARRGARTGPQRAFSMWFQGVNLAEKVHRIRRRRAYFLSDAARPQPGGVEDAIAQLKARGLTLDQVLSAHQEPADRAGVHRPSDGVAHAESVAHAAAGGGPDA
jgi:hypothetical protein